MPLLTIGGTRATSPMTLGGWLRERQSITTRQGGLHAEPLTPGRRFSEYLGRVYERAQVQEQLSRADYIAWSVGTPLLWHEHPEGGWHMPRLYFRTIRDNRTLHQHALIIREAMNATAGGMIFHPSWHGSSISRGSHSWCRYAWSGWVCTLPRGHSRQWWHEAWQDTGNDPVSAMSPTGFVWNRDTMLVGRRPRA